MAYDLLSSFERAPRAQGKSPSTISSYTETVRFVNDFARSVGRPTLTGSIRREHIEQFLVHLQTTPNTCVLLVERVMGFEARSE